MTRVVRVLDTMTVSAIMRGNALVVARLAACRRPDTLLPQPVVSEVAYGLARLPSSKRRSRLEARLAAILEEIPRAAWSDAVSQRFGSIKAALEHRGVPIEDFDAAIAAHALAYDAVLVTANGRHMRRIPGLQVENWMVA